MAIPLSGNLSIKATAGTCRSLCTAVVQAGGTGTGGLRSLTTQTFGVMINNGSMRQFYGYNPSTESISVSNPVTVNFSGQIAINTITASGAWTATKVDSSNIINSFSSSGSGGGKITAGLTGLQSFQARVATITYCITASPSTTATWQININPNT